MPYTNTNTQREIENANGDLVVQDSNNRNNESNGVLINATKDADGGAWESRLNGALIYVKNEGEGGSAHSANGIKAYTRHEGGKIAFVNGHYQDINELGTGDVTALYGSYDKVHTTGDSPHTIDYFIGHTVGCYNYNPNLSINRLGAANFQIHFEANTEVNNECYVMLLDIDKLDSTAVNVDGDFSFLYIKDHTLNGVPTCTGEARAINSKSTLPSEFAGTVEANGLKDNGIQEFADNAAAIAGGLAVGTHYRTGDLLKIVH